jgi:hypothetical protein
MGVVVDGAQWLSAPCLEYLRNLWDDPGMRVALVLCGAGSERVARWVPSLASRVGAWLDVQRLAPADVPEMMAAFHPLWGAAGAAEVGWVDEHAAGGSARGRR